MLDKRLVFKEIWRQEGRTGIRFLFAENMKGIKNSLMKGFVFWSNI